MVAKKKSGVEEQRHGGSSGLPKLLASPDKKVRQRAIRLLVAWLSAQRRLTDLDLLKIWKGLFYCVWHTDKAPIQADLIERLASLLTMLDVGISHQFFGCFLSTIRREWGGIDRLRLDKFYLLIRKFLSSMFKLLHSQNWDEAWIMKFMTTISEKAFLADDLLPAQGVNLHLVEIFLVELNPFLPVSIQALGCLLEPFYSVLSHSSDKILLERVKESVFMCLLKEAESIQRRDGSMDSKLGAIASRLPLADRLFELAAAKAVGQGNRRILYKLHEEMRKMPKLQAPIEECVYASEKSSPQGEPLGSNAEANSRKIGQIRKRKKQKIESRGISKENHGLRSLKTADGSADVAASDAYIAQTEDDSPAAKQLVFSKDATVRIPNDAAQKTQATEGQQFGEMVKENPDLHKKGETSSLKRKTSTSSGQKVLRKKTQKEKRDDPLDNHVPRSNGMDNESAALSEGESIDVDEAGDDKFIVPMKKYPSSTSDDFEDSPTPSDRTFSQLARSPRGTGIKKGKKTGLEETLPQSSQIVESTGVSPVLTGGKSNINGSDKKIKKVRFSLKHNVVWKPKSPLPPENLRLPRASTPRGSALKKGVPPGPIQASAPPFKRTRKVIMRRWLLDSSTNNPWNLMLKMSPTPMKKKVTLT